MDTRRLAQYCAIVECGSLTSAAELLSVSHSGLSKAMALLQQELGVSLFRPRGRGLEVTDQGRAVYLKSKTILAQVDALRVPDAPAQSAARVAMPEVCCLALAGPLARAAQGSVELYDFDAGGIEVQVAERKVDFGFTFVPFPSSEVEHLRIGAGALTSYARRGAFAGRDAEGVPYVVPAFALADNPLTLKTRDGWNRQLARVTPLRASSLTMALGVVHEGLAAIYIPQFLAAALNARLREPEQLVQLEMSAARRVKETTRRELFLVKRRADDETLTMRRATREVRAVLRVHR